ncbi:MAG: hypothetical protein VW080_02230 [Flavobacteriaceae bacterium]
MNFGGAFLSSKHKYLKSIPNKWKPKSIRITDKIALEDLIKKINDIGIQFPLIAKPDMGERGRNVQKIECYNELKFYLKKMNQAILIQEFIEYPIELGILFYWDLQGNPQISSVGKKKFCELEGNGKVTLEKLVLMNHRIAHRKKNLKKKFAKQWNQIIPNGKKIRVEPIGNHNRGTVFLDAQKYRSEEMKRWVANCAKKIPGFDYGRIDLKIKDWDSFKYKRGIKIIEINGVNSEPIHIYDPKYSIWKAYRDIFYHMHIIYKLSKPKLNQQTQTHTLCEFIRGSRVTLSKNKPSLISYT